MNDNVGDTEAVGSSLIEVDSPITDEAKSIEDSPITGGVANVGIADEEIHISDDVEAATVEAATVTHQMEAIGDHKVPRSDGPTAVDGEASEPQHAVEKSSAPAIEVKQLRQLRCRQRARSR